MTFKLLFAILLTTLGPALGSECDKLDSLPIQPNCTVKRSWTMYCEVNGQKFSFNKVSVPPGLLSISTDQPQPTKCEPNTTVTVKDTITATETTTTTKTTRFKVTRTVTRNTRVRVTRTATVTTTATIPSTAVATSTSIVTAPSPTPGVYRDCKDALNKGVTQSGVYTIQPDSLQPFDVSCDMDTDGGGWAVFQRRQDGSVNFYRNWDNYTAGFGDLFGEFWLGLDNINRLTNASSSELRVDLADFENETAYAKYSSFQVGDASTKYVLTVSGYNGTAGDSLDYHHGYTFSTYDQDNDGYEANCAIARKGAWWYDFCNNSNLNGQYLRGQNTSSTAVNWGTWRAYDYSLKFSEMKVRPSN